MKSSLPLVVFLTGAVANAIPAIDLGKRQFSSLFGASKPALVATVLKTLTPEYDQKATRGVYMYGPFTLPPSNATHAGTGFSTSGIKLDPSSDTPGGYITPPCKDCTVYKAMATFNYKDGSLADVKSGVYTHHIIIADYSGKSQVIPPVQGFICPGGGIISPLPPMSGMGPKASTGAKPAGGAPPMAGMSHGGMAKRNLLSKRQLGLSVFIGGGGSVASGNPFSPRPGSNVKSGYWIGPKGSMQLTSEIVNYDPKPKELYLSIEMEWVQGKDAEMLDVGMGALSADKCSDKEKGILHPPKDKPIVYQGEEWVVMDDGYFMNFTPHIHDGGVNIKVYVNQKEVCEARAVYGSEGGSAKSLDGTTWQTITGYTPCDKPIAIKKGDKVSMSSEYDLTKYRLRPDNQHADEEAEGMALANFIFARPFYKPFWST